MILLQVPSQSPAVSKSEELLSQMYLVLSSFSCMQLPSVLLNPYKILASTDSFDNKVAGLRSRNVC